MMLHRIVELQAHSVIRKITDDQDEYEFIEGLIESQKPAVIDGGYHYLIKTPFRYPLPVEPRYSGRFKPPFHPRNCFYGAQFYPTSAYEYAYHWLSQRVHIAALSQDPQPRTHFQVKFSDKKCVDLTRHPDIEKMMQRNDYGPSQRFVETHPELDSILYFSCRDPERRNCVVTFEIATLAHQVKAERTLDFIYQAAARKCVIQDPMLRDENLEIFWDELC